MTDVRLPQIAREVLRAADGQIRYADVSREVLKSADGQIKAGVVAREVLRSLGTSATQINVYGVCREVLLTRARRSRLLFASY